jgi:hypothetical protein
MLFTNIGVAKKATHVVRVVEATTLRFLPGLFNKRLSERLGRFYE